MKTARCMRWLEYAHAALIFALPVPLVCAVFGLTEPAGTPVLFIKCLLPAVPVIITDITAGRVRSLMIYLSVCTALLAGVYGITLYMPQLLGNGRLSAYQVCYGIGMLIETLIIGALRFQDRVSASQRRRQEDPLLPRTRGFLKDPTAPLLWYFTVCYLIGQCLSSAALCDIAFFSAAGYVFLVLFYGHIKRTDAYLESNHRVSGLPRKRLARISMAMLLVFAAMLSAAMLPSFLLAASRPYTDIREWLRDVEMEPFDQEDGPGFRPAGPLGVEDMLAALDADRQVRETPVIVHILLGGLMTACILVFAYGVFLAVRQMVKDFRAEPDENGDVVEEIIEEEDSAPRDVGKRRHPGSAESEAQRIRRRYKKTIRRHRKDRPAPHESPAEIEANAGLKGDGQMEQLHRQYEYARYRG